MGHDASEEARPLHLWRSTFGLGAKIPWNAERVRREGDELIEETAAVRTMTRR